MTNYEIRLAHRRGQIRRMNARGLTSRGTPMRQRRRVYGQSKSEYQREYRARLAREGLTIRGTVRQKRQWPKLRGLTVREQDRVRTQFYRDQNERLGLTRHGDVRALFRTTAREQAWRDLRASMNIQRPEILTELERAA